MTNAHGKSGMTPTESETTSTVENFPRGSRETPATSASSMEADRSEKARCHKSDMHVAGESDSPIVPEKPANKGSVPLSTESAAIVFDTPFWQGKDSLILYDERNEREPSGRAIGGWAAERAA